MSDNWKPGDHYLIDDQTGLKIRASESVTQWDGLVVHQREYEPRQPQDFVRAKRESQSVRMPRPMPIDTFIGPLDTEIAVAGAAGDTSIEVLSTIRMEAGDRLSIMLDSGDTFMTTVDTIFSAAIVNITSPLPGPVSVGKKVFDNTAMSLSDLY